MKVEFLVDGFKFYLKNQKRLYRSVKGKCIDTDEVRAERWIEKKKAQASTKKVGRK